eukprot:TRINITY_DN18531_c2_g1_i2.p1 TRINITY_DN18531_c2_g1~~TRINITY_DN18531_c2_g1_i2.p1  ORF type:complete len:511 (-),score=102.94 TRINITY_DN18531_c2_g1_i2:137-1669(-)
MASSATGGSSSSAADPAPCLPQIRRLRVCLLGGDTAVGRVGKADVAAALLRGFTADWPAPADPTLSFGFNYGVFERKWLELNDESADQNFEGSKDAGDRWGIGPLGAWSKRCIFEDAATAGKSKEQPPYTADASEDCASLCAGSAEKLNLGPSATKGFREALCANEAGPWTADDLFELEGVHRKIFAMADARPRELVRLDRPCRGLLAAFARFSPEVGKKLPGCGAAILDIFEPGRRPLGCSHNVAMLYVAPPNGRLHAGLSPGAFLAALQFSSSNIMRLLREYNSLVLGKEVSERELAEWRKVDLRSRLEFIFDARNLKKDWSDGLQVFQGSSGDAGFAADTDGWLPLERVRTFHESLDVGGATERELLEVLRSSRSVEVKTETDGTSYVRHARSKHAQAIWAERRKRKAVEEAAASESAKQAEEMAAAAQAQKEAEEEAWRPKVPKVIKPPSRAELFGFGVGGSATTVKPPTSTPLQRLQARDPAPDSKFFRGAPVQIKGLMKKPQRL